MIPRRVSHDIYDIQDKPKEEVITWDVPPMSEYETLKDEDEGLKWRLIPKPGGAVVRPAAGYEMWAATQQAAKGGQTSDKAMWAGRGGLDCDGRERGAGAVAHQAAARRGVGLPRVAPAIPGSPGC